MIYGLDYLGGCIFKSIILNNHPPGWGAGFFANTFGNAWPVINELAQTGKCPRIRIHALWTNHSYKPSRDDKLIMQEFKRAKALKKKFPDVDVQFSPVCESDNDLSSILKKLTKDSEGVRLVNSVNKAPILKGYINEVHGNKKPPKGLYNYSYDGTSTVDSDVEKDKQTYKDADTLYLWHPNFNLKYKTRLSGDEPAHVKKNDSAPPKKRNCKPTADLIRSLIPFARAKGKTQVPKGYILKSHGDRNMTPAESRAYKPVYITPKDVNPKNLKLVGQITEAISSEAKPFNDENTGALIGWRYYFSEYGYKIAQHPVNLIGDGKLLAIVNPSFRDGVFR